MTSIDLIQKLYDMGYNYSEIAVTVGCSRQNIQKRLRGYESQKHKENAQQRSGFVYKKTQDKGYMKQKRREYFITHRELYAELQRKWRTKHKLICKV